jgi:hypothetical protein
MKKQKKNRRFFCGRLRELPSPAQELCDTDILVIAIHLAQQTSNLSYLYLIISHLCASKLSLSNLALNLLDGNFYQTYPYRTDLYKSYLRQKRSNFSQRFNVSPWNLPRIYLYQAISSHVELSVGMALWLRGFRLWIGMKRIEKILRDVEKMLGWCSTGSEGVHYSWLWHITYYDFEKELLQKKNVGLRGCLLAHRHIHTQTHLPQALATGLHKRVDMMVVSLFVSFLTWFL